MKTPVFTGTCTALITPLSGLWFHRLCRLCPADGPSAGIRRGRAVCLRHHRGKFHPHCAGTCPSGGLLRVPRSGPVQSGCRLRQQRHRRRALSLSACPGIRRRRSSSGHPYYNKTTQTGLIHHYEYLADKTDLPVILYNVPSRTGLSFTAETYRILSQHPRINGTKEASEISLFWQKPWLSAEMS